MASSEQFSDNEMEAFLDAEMRTQIDVMRVEQEREIVADRVWSAINTLDMNLAVTRDPLEHEDQFTELKKEVAEIISLLPQSTAADYSLADHIEAIANSIWDEQIMMIEQIALALDTQLHGSLPLSEKALIKKKIMARIAIKDDNQKDWLALADAVLDGDPLDTTNPDDFAVITEALEIAANLDNTPEVKLYDSVLSALGVPDLSQEIPADYDLAQIELLTYAARDIAEATFCKADQAQQPDRHATIHEVIRDYGLVDEVDVQTICTLADAYATSKSLQM